MPDKDAIQLIAEVTELHQFICCNASSIGPEDHCSCGLRPYGWIQYASHLAAEVDKALGGLTKVWSEVVVMDDGYTYPQWNEWYDEQHHAQKAVYDNPGTVLGEAFMSGWTVTE